MRISAYYTGSILAAAFGACIFGAPASAFDGHWIGIVHDESEAEECAVYANAPIQAAANKSRFYGWAQIGSSWHKVTGKISHDGQLSGHIANAEALDPETLSTGSGSAMQFNMTIGGDLAQGTWSAPNGCNGAITAHKP